MIEPVDERIARLGSPEAHERELALDELGDLFEAKETKDAELRRGLLAIQKVLESETEHAVLKSALHAANAASALGHGKLVSWGGLARTIGRFERDAQLLEYVLAILGASGQPSLAPVVARFTDHQDEQVRGTAREALETLEALERP